MPSLPRARAMRVLLALVLATGALLSLPPAAGARPLTISAAASLTQAFRELGARFEEAHPGVTLRFNFAASGVLVQQITQGAPVDVFASADQATMDRGVEQKVIDAATRRDFAGNAVVLITPAQDGAAIAALEALQGDAIRRIAVGKPATVPVGRYTRQALEAARLWEALQPKVVLADNVRQVLDYVARGEVDAGFVYRTDAAIMADKVRVAFVVQGHAPVSYPVAVVAGTPQRTQAQAFVDFLSGPQARAVLARHGFTLP